VGWITAILSGTIVVSKGLGIAFRFESNGVNMKHIYTQARSLSLKIQQLHSEHNIRKLDPEKKLARLNKYSTELDQLEMDVYNRSNASFTNTSNYADKISPSDVQDSIAHDICTRYQDQVPLQQYPPAPEVTPSPNRSDRYKWYNPKKYTSKNNQGSNSHDVPLTPDIEQPENIYPQVRYRNSDGSVFITNTNGKAEE